jgi:hypothetical protein
VVVKKNAAKDVDGEVMLMSASEIHLRKCLIGRMKMMSHVREQSISSMTVYDRYRCVVMEVKIVGQLNSSTKFWSGLKVDELLCTANGVMPLVPRCNAGGKNEASFFTLVSNRISSKFKKDYFDHWDEFVVHKLKERKGNQVTAAQVDEFRQKIVSTSHFKAQQAHAQDAAWLRQC